MSVDVDPPVGSPNRSRIRHSNTVRIVMLTERPLTVDRSPTVRLSARHMDLDYRIPYYRIIIKRFGRQMGHDARGYQSARSVCGSTS